MSLYRGLGFTLALLATTVATPGGEPERGTDGPKRMAHCYEEQFADGTGEYNAVRIPADKSPSLIPADDYCLDTDPAACRNLMPLDKTRHWLSGARAGSWVCVSDGTLSGWAPARQLELGPAPATEAKDWLGIWNRRYGGASFRIAFADDKKTLHVVGTAEWRGGPDATPNLGDLDADGRLVGNELRLGEPKCLDYDYNEAHEECYECVARLMMINGRIFVIDNRMCGGMNVNFDGIYDRAPAKKPKKGKQ